MQMGVLLLARGRLLAPRCLTVVFRLRCCAYTLPDPTPAESPPPPRFVAVKTVSRSPPEIVGNLNKHFGDRNGRCVALLSVLCRLCIGAREATKQADRQIRLLFRPARTMMSLSYKAA